MRNHIANFMIVSCNRKDFNQNELLQCYINGGIFLQSLLLSIHAYGLGSIPFQCPISLNSNPRFHLVTGLTNDDIVIAIVGFGVIDYSKPILCAERKEVSEISQQIPNV